MLTNCFRRYPLSLLSLLAVVVLSLIPVGRIELMEDVPLADKWTHMVMYAGLTAVVWIEHLWHRRTSPSAPSLLWGAVGPVALGGLLELIQEYLTTYRSGEWLDVVADALGVAAGIGVGMLALWTARRRGA